MNFNTVRSLFPGLAPLLASPATLTALGIGAAGWVILKWLSEDEDEGDDPAGFNGSEPSLEPLEAGQSTADNLSGVRDAPPHGTIDPRGSQEVENPLEDTPETVGETAQPLPSGDRDKSKLIRQAMSELGKRSAAARARKKNLNAGSFPK